MKCKCKGKICADDSTEIPYCMECGANYCPECYAVKVRTEIVAKESSKRCKFCKNTNYVHYEVVCPVCDYTPKK